MAVEIAHLTCGPFHSEPAGLVVAGAMAGQSCEKIYAKVHDGILEIALPKVITDKDAEKNVRRINVA